MTLFEVPLCFTIAVLQPVAGNNKKQQQQKHIKTNSEDKTYPQIYKRYISIRKSKRNDIGNYDIDGT